VRDIDTHLLRLREIEARIAFAEFYLREQQEHVQRLTRMGFAVSLAHDLLRSMQDSLVILRQRRDDLLAGMQAADFDPKVALGRSAPDRPSAP
jgi:hypothetical protein